MPVQKYLENDMVIFPTRTASMVKNGKMHLICKQFEKTMPMLLIVL